MIFSLFRTNKTWATFSVYIKCSVKICFTEAPKVMVLYLKRAEFSRINIKQKHAN